MIKQITSAEINDELSTARTGKKEFLDKIDKIIPWEEWKAIVRPHYYNGECGNKPYPIELVLRIYILQNLYDLADMGIMTEVLDSRTFSDFCGINLPNEVPKGIQYSTIIQATSSAKNKEKKRDREAHSVEKGIYGMVKGG